MILGADPESAREAQRELFVGNYDHAVDLYRVLLKENPSWAPGYYGLVRSLISAHEVTAAYEAAAEGLRRAPPSPETLTAAGLADYRRGDLAAAEAHFMAAYKLNARYPGALAGIASVYQAISKNKSANALYEFAHKSVPDDPSFYFFGIEGLIGTDSRQEQGIRNW